MHVSHPLHAWNPTPTEAVALQRELREKVRTDVSVPLDGVRTVAGVDMSSSKNDPLLTAGIVVWDRIENRVVEAVSARVASPFPYVPGLLSFREIPVLLEAITQLHTEPDVWCVDGQGIAHPRRLGIATHLGLLIKRPTIGVAKSKLTGTYDPAALEAAGETPLLDGGETIGLVLRTKPRTNPLFLSPGHLIDHASAIAIVKACLRTYRLPEPTRLAHLHVNDARIASSRLSLL